MKCDVRISRAGSNHPPPQSPRHTRWSYKDNLPTLQPSSHTHFRRPYSALGGIDITGNSIIDSDSLQQLRPAELDIEQR